MSKIQRLDKVLDNMGYGSRKEVKKLIKDGFIRVNNKTIVKNDFKLDPYIDEILINGERLYYREYIYLMMNKPQGLVSSTDDPQTETVIDLLEDQYQIFNPFPAGRLDKDTEGLLLITNDGKLAHEILSPKKGVFKTYYVEVDGYIEEGHKEDFREGLVLDDGYKTLPAELEIIEAGIISKARLKIQEGKYHQVKRMFESLSMKVIYLKRIAMGLLELDSDLELGQYRELREDELILLKNL